MIDCESKKGSEEKDLWAVIMSTAHFPSPWTFSSLLGMASLGGKQEVRDFWPIDSGRELKPVVTFGDGLFGGEQEVRDLFWAMHSGRERA